MNRQYEKWVKEKPCKRAVLLSSASAEQNDSTFQNSPMDNAHHEDTTSKESFISPRKGHKKGKRVAESGSTLAWPGGKYARQNLYSQEQLYVHHFSDSPSPWKFPSLRL